MRDDDPVDEVAGAATTPASVAQRPHYWTVYLAVAAMVVSCFGLWQSYLSRIASEQALELNRASLRPFLQAVSATWQPTTEADALPRVRVVIQNSGKTAATGIVLAVRTSSDPRDYHPGGRAAFDELAPGSQLPYTLDIETFYRNELGGGRVQLLLIGELSFEGVSSTRQKTQFCFVDQLASGPWPETLSTLLGPLEACWDTPAGVAK
jgi:hypothetical protein